jgi:hypothetical protein
VPPLPDGTLGHTTRSALWPGSKASLRRCWPVPHLAPWTASGTAMPPLPAVAEGALRPVLAFGRRGPASLELLGSAILGAVHHPPQCAFLSLVFALPVDCGRPHRASCALGLLKFDSACSPSWGSLYHHHLACCYSSAAALNPHCIVPHAIRVWHAIRAWLCLQCTKLRKLRVEMSTADD